MQFHDAVADAINRVLAWDVPDEGLSGALVAEAGHLARVDSEEPVEDH